MKSTLTFLVFLMLTNLMIGCNTMAGFGKDVEKVGGKIENAAKK